MNAPRFTIADLDALSDLVIAPGYRLLMNRVAAELERRRGMLETTQDEAHTAECRGQIHALRTVLAIPVILRDEIQTQMEDDEDGV